MMDMLQRLIVILCLFSIIQISFAQNDSFFNMNIHTTDPKEVEAIEKVGDMVRNNSKNEAIKTLKSLIRENNKFYEAHFILAYIYKQDKKYEKAIKYTSEAIRISPKASEPYFVRANCKMELGRYSSALGDYRMSIRMNKNLYGAYNNIGIVRIKNQNIAPAHERDLRRAIKDIETLPDLAELKDKKVYFNLGFINGALGEYKDSRRYLNQSIEIDSSWGKAYYYRGLAYYYDKDFENALTDFSIALDLGFKPEESTEFVEFIEFVLKRIQF